MIDRETRRRLSASASTRCFILNVSGRLALLLFSSLIILFSSARVLTDRGCREVTIQQVLHDTMRVVSTSSFVLDADRSYRGITSSDILTW